MKKLFLILFLFILFSISLLTLLQVDIPRYSNEAPVNYGEHFRKNVELYMNRQLGLRTFFIDLYGRANELTGKTGSEKVILGKKGMLFYYEDLKDTEQCMQPWIIGKTAERVQNLKLELAEQGKSLCILIAPNKSSVYPQYLPYYVKLSEEARNIDVFIDEMKHRNIDYINPLPLLIKSDELLYYKKDSHWNSKGAYLAYKMLMEGIKLPYLKEGEYKDIVGEAGDLQLMFLPGTRPNEEIKVFNIEKSYTNSKRIHSINDMQIETKCKTGQGKMLFIHDSFGIGMFEYLANSINELKFSRSYDDIISQAEGYDFVVIEIVERNLGSILY